MNDVALQCDFDTASRQLYDRSTLERAFPAAAVHAALPPPWTLLGAAAGIAHRTAAAAVPAPVPGESESRIEAHLPSYRQTRLARLGHLLAGPSPPATGGSLPVQLADLVQATAIEQFYRLQLRQVQERYAALQLRMQQLAGRGRPPGGSAAAGREGGATSATTV